MWLKAVKAMARYLACLLYRMLTKGEDWVDRGAAYFEQRRQARELHHLPPANQLDYRHPNPKSSGRWSKQVTGETRRTTGEDTAIGKIDSMLRPFRATL